MPAKRDDSNPTEQLLDLFVYAPVGIALEAVDNLPKFIERGKSQVTLGRFVARSAAKRGGSTIESIGERLVHEAGQVIVDLFGIDLTKDAPESEEPEPAPASPGPTSDHGLPIAQYDSQAASQILKLLAQLTPEERDQIEEHETAGRKRVTILRKIAQLRGDG